MLRVPGRRHSWALYRRAGTRLTAAVVTGRAARRARLYRRWLTILRERATVLPSVGRLQLRIVVGLLAGTRGRGAGARVGRGLDRHLAAVGRRAARRHDGRRGGRGVGGRGDHVHARGGRVRPQSAGVVPVECPAPCRPVALVNVVAVAVVVGVAPMGVALVLLTRAALHARVVGVALVGGHAPPAMQLAGVDPAHNGGVGALQVRYIIILRRWVAGGLIVTSHSRHVDEVQLFVYALGTHLDLLRYYLVFEVLVFFFTLGRGDDESLQKYCNTRRVVV